MTFPFQLIYSQEPQGWDVPEMRSGTHRYSRVKFTYIILEYTLGHEGERSIMLSYKQHFPPGSWCRWCSLSQSCARLSFCPQMRGGMCWDITWGANTSLRGFLSPSRSVQLMLVWDVPSFRKIMSDPYGWEQLACSLVHLAYSFLDVKTSKLTYLLSQPGSMKQPLHSQSVQPLPKTHIPWPTNLLISKRNRSALAMRSSSCLCSSSRSTSPFSGTNFRS